MLAGWTCRYEVTGVLKKNCLELLATEEDFLED